MSDDDILSPASYKQELFINSDTDITVFGGAAGSGKSYLGVMDFLKWTDDPRFRGVMVRRTTPQLKGPGGLFDTATDMYRKVYPKIKTSRQDGRFTFPSGAEISLKHCEHVKDKHNFQGWQIGLCLIDEAQQLPEEVVVYLISRLRTEAKMKPHMKMTCNPEFDSFLRVWLLQAGYIDENNYGIPKPEMDGVVKWFIRVGNEMVWASSAEELIATYGSDCGPMSFRFISAKCTDNPPLLKRDPLYLSRLQALPRVERMRLLDGAWMVRESTSGLFKREWCEVVPGHLVSDDIMNRARSWDTAATLPSEKYPDPDYTVGLRGSVDSSGCVWIEHMVRFRGLPSKVEQTILDTAISDGKEYVVTIPEENGSHGKKYASEMAAKIFSEGLSCKKMPVGNVKNRKLVNFKRVSAMAECGLIKIVKGDWNNIFFEELEAFDGHSTAFHDDIVDTISDLVEYLATKKPYRTLHTPIINSPTAIANRDRPI